jgi:uncharacterized protein
MLGIAAICALAIGGLLYVKWMPYYHKAFTALSDHSIGRSILTGDAPYPPAVSFQAALAYAVAYGLAIWKAMLLGLALGAALQELAPPDWVARALGRPGWRNIAAGGLLAIPGMMCTCCAAPVVIGLRQQRAASPPAVAFWLGNTLFNPATLVFMGFVLGWRWSALRLLFGLLIVVAASYLVMRWGGRNQVVQSSEALATQAANYHPTFSGWLKKFLYLAWGLIPEYLLLVLALGGLRAWIFPEVDPGLHSSALWIVLAALAGLIFVIPTAGEVPIVQAMLGLGVGVGPALALLLTLPPVSLPSLLMLKRAFSTRELLLVATAVLGIGTLAGLMMVALTF